MRMSSSDQPERLSGAYCTQQQLAGLRLQAKSLSLQARYRARNINVGNRQSGFRGRGLEFAEVRAYQAGDDIRSIDWRVTARSDRVYTKLFHEEREKPLLFVCDQRQTMFFGSQYCFKSVLAAEVCSLLAWAGLNQGDRVGGMVFGNNGHRETRPKRRRQAVLQLTQHIASFNQNLRVDSGIDLDPGESLNRQLEQLQAIAATGSSIYFCSDFNGYNTDTEKRLFQLRRHCQVTAIQISDPLEQQAPPPGRYRISNGRDSEFLEINSRRTQQQYQQLFRQQQQQLEQSLTRLHIVRLDCSTHRPALDQLSRFFQVRR